jgi:hypothetical protein
MTDGKGCTRLPFTFNSGEVLEPIQFGNENKEELLLYERCPECGCEKGHFHHIGCGIELCPKCKETSVKCSCDK